MTAAIGRVLDEWGVDSRTTLVCGGARGADLIAAEAVLDRGGRVIVCLALPEDRFIAESVALAGTDDWVGRFRAVLDRSEVRPPPDHPRRHDDDGSGDVFVVNNTRMMDLAGELGDAPYVLAVWDGNRGDGPGGTADVVQRCVDDTDRGPEDGVAPWSHVRIVDPTPRSA